MVSIRLEAIATRLELVSACASLRSALLDPLRVRAQVAQGFQGPRNAVDWQTLVLK